jgi:hypothetical protein
METIFNPELQLAFDFVQYTNKNIFLTGKAGTGKTTFLRNLRTQSPKRMIVVAPTGVAAINAGGVTIHSFFQMPFGPHLPNDQLTEVTGSNNNRERFPAGYTKLSREKINIIKSLDLLVIDEISMVRADLLDGIDEVLRRFRDKNRPFGGVQLLLIGDIQQLPPVIKDNEWDILQRYYDTMFFFGSRALQKTNYVSVELKHIYRQSDRKFIDILNHIRENKIDTETLVELNKRYVPDFIETAGEGYIILTTHNAQAQSINDDKLNKLSGKPKKFKAAIDGEFPEYSYPTDVELTLKKGAQVMFVKNDTSREKLFYNGKIGTLLRFDEEENVIWIKCPDRDEPIGVSPMAWENMKFTIDDETKEINETVIGSFTQYPLKLAWAITIHKSQGLTFEKAIIDARASFAHGQVYVALSRCKTLEGMVLSRPISIQSIKNDSTVTQFSADIEQNPPGQKQLSDSKREYQQMMLAELFDFNPLQIRIFQLLKVLRENSTIVFGNVGDLSNAMLESFKTEVMQVNGKFTVQLQQLMGAEGFIEENVSLQDRIQKASVYYMEKLESLILQVLPKIAVETDNKTVRRDIMDILGRLLEDTSVKTACLKACQTGFTVKSYLETRAKASLEKYTLKSDTKAPVTEQVSDKILHPLLYNTLKSWRNAMATELGLPHYMILPQKALVALVNELPWSMERLLQVKGFGKKKVDTYGDEILEIINDFRKDKNIETTVEQKLPQKPTKKPKEDTRKISYDLFESGKTIEEIAVLRGMTNNTIEGHLTHYVGLGILDIYRLVTPEKVARISEYFLKKENLKLGPAKEALGDSISWDELRMVAAFLQNKNL